jgi:hypothetical protein
LSGSSIAIGSELDAKCVTQKRFDQAPRHTFYGKLSGPFTVAVLDADTYEGAVDDLQAYGDRTLCASGEASVEILNRRTSRRISFRTSGVA